MPPGSSAVGPELRGTKRIRPLLSVDAALACRRGDEDVRPPDLCINGNRLAAPGEDVDIERFSLGMGTSPSKLHRSM